MNGGSGAFTVNAPVNCSWTAFTTNSFVQINSGSGTGPGTVNYTVVCQFRRRTNRIHHRRDRHFYDLASWIRNILDRAIQYQRHSVVRIGIIVDIYSAVRHGATGWSSYQPGISAHQ